MNSMNVLMYIIFTMGTLYAMWLILNIVWFGISILAHRIYDEISFYKWKKYIRDKL